jgi:chromate transporter
MSGTAVPPSSSALPPSHADLFLAFFRITLSGFGGTLPWTRRMFIEQKKWMTEEEFNEAYALCQFLPGPNIVNLTSVFGSRMRGPTGAMAAWAGFLVLPFCVMLASGVLYQRYGDVDAVRRILAGIAPAAAGLIVATVAKMATPIFRSLGPGPFIVLAVMLAIGLLRWPLLPVLLVLAPTSVALAFWMRQR